MKFLLKILLIIITNFAPKSFALAENSTISRGINITKSMKFVESEKQKCLDKCMGSICMRNCLMDAYDEWDKELNRLYHAIIEINKKPRLKKFINIKIFIESQKSWIKFRDAEYKVLDEMTNVIDQGTMWNLTITHMQLEILKDRVNYLQSYLHTIERVVK